MAGRRRSGRGATASITAAVGVALAAACSSGGEGGDPAPTPPQAEPADSVVLFEDFTAPSLDRSSWNVIVTGFWVNNEQQAYIDSEEVLHILPADAAADHNGALEIQAHHRPGFTTAEGRTFDFVSGRINTRDRVQFTYGTAAARMKLPPGEGLWPAFWALGNGDWPGTGEIDVMEYVGDRSWVSSALHGPGYSGDTPLVRRYTFPAGEDATGWHVYSVTWSTNELVFKVDDHVSYRVSRTAVEAFGPWAFDNPKFLILNLALGGAYPQGVNGISDPYPGLPQATVDGIEEGEARVLVDWVRVTRN